MVGGVEFVVRGGGLEALEAVPGHVLQGEKGAIGREEVIQVADADDSVIGTFDDVLQDAVLRWPERLIRYVLVVAGAAEDVRRRTQIPIGAQGSVDGFLHVGAVEVDGCAGGLVVTGVYDTKLGPDMRARVKDVVDVEARVYFERGIEDIGEDVAAGG